MCLIEYSTFLLDSICLIVRTETVWSDILCHILLNVSDHLGSRLLYSAQFSCMRGKRRFVTGCDVTLEHNPRMLCRRQYGGYCVEKVPTGPRMATCSSLRQAPSVAQGGLPWPKAGGGGVSGNVRQLVCLLHVKLTCSLM